MTVHTRPYTRAFNGGEISPDAYGRVDDPKYQAGFGPSANYIPLPHGPVDLRTGFAFVRAARYADRTGRMISFTYSNTQTMALEFGHLYVRFHTAGATLESSPGVAYEVATPYAEADLASLKFVQSNDVLTITHVGYAPRELRRAGALSWSLVEIPFETTLDAPTDVTTVANTSGGATNLIPYEYAVTTVGADGLDESLISASASVGAATITAITLANPGVFTVSSYSAGLTVGQRVIISGVVGTTQLNGNSYRIAYVDGGGGTYDEYGGYYPDPITSVRLQNEDGTDLNTSAMTAYVSGGTISIAGVNNNLFLTGNFNTVSWTAAANAEYYNVYKLSNGVWGFIGQTTFTSFKDDNIDADISKTPPLASNPFDGAGDYPGAVTYFEQRRCFAGTTNDPQLVEMTRSGTESNLNYSIPSRDDDAISFRIKARESNLIRHLVPLNDLVALTASGEWRISSSTSDAITPDSVSVRPQSYVGANDAQPVIVNSNLIYGAARGGHVREMSYNWQASGYVTGDLCLRSAHLFDGYSTTDIAYAKAPVPIVWVVSSSGNLLSLTYVPEQQIGAWAKHTTDGVFESVCVVAEDEEDVVYALIRRTINGNVVRYVERKREQQFATLSDAFYVDSGVTFEGTDVTTVTGLSHLEGETVSVLVDGAEHPQAVVSGGEIDLEFPGDKIQVGLPYFGDLSTLPIVADVPGLGQGVPMNVNRVWIRVYRSSGLLVGPDFDNLTEVPSRTDEVYGSPPDLKSEVIEVAIEPSWSQGGVIALRQSSPLPMMIVSITSEVVIGG